MEEIIQVSIIASKDVYPVHMQGLLWRIGIISEATWCTWKNVLRLQVRAFKNCKIWHFGNSSGHVEQTHLRFPKCLWSLTLNEMLIKLVSLIIYSINANLTNISSTPPSEVKKAVLYSTFNNFLYLNRNLYLLGI